MPVKRAASAQRLPPAERRAEILEAAYEAFATLGYDGVSMEEIARRVGVTKPILYRHFASKDALCAACFYVMGEEMLRIVSGAIDPTSSPDRQMWAGIDAQLRFIHDRAAEWRVFVREAPLRGGEAVKALEAGRLAVTEMLAETIGGAIKAKGNTLPPRLEVEALAHVLFGAVEQMSLWWEAHPEQPVELVALRTMNFVWQGYGQLIEGRIWIPGASPG